MISIFLPIRKGSKRVKDKNFRPLPGYKFGLTEIKINQFKKLKKLYKHNLEFVVSTNCKKTILFLKKINWIKIHIRSDKDASDDSLDKLIKIVPQICNGKYILWTHVTSPFFTERDYYNFIKIFKKNRKYKSAFSSDLIQKFIYSKKRGWVSHNIKKKKWPRTQDLEKLYVANSSAFITSKEIYEKQKNRLCDNPLPIISEKNKGFDLDNYDDFIELKKKLKNKIVL